MGFGNPPRVVDLKRSSAAYRTLRAENEQLRAELAALRERIETLCREWYAERAVGDFGAASRLCADEIRAAIAAVPSGEQEADR